MTEIKFGGKFFTRLEKKKLKLVNTYVVATLATYIAV